MCTRAAKSIRRRVARLRVFVTRITIGFDCMERRDEDAIMTNSRECTRRGRW